MAFPKLTIVMGHGITSHEGNAISEFKAKCHAILEEVCKTRKPIRVTRFGEPVAEIVPPSIGESKRRRLVSMAGTARILGDIVGPTGSFDDWDAWRGN